MVSSVLVIDRGVTLTELLKATLDPKAFEVHPAQEMQDVNEAIQRLEPDVIVLDLYQPQNDGWRVCREIRKTTKIPILILSVFNDPDSIAKALDEGADDYLIKPVPSGVLIAHLNNLIRRSRAEQVALKTQEDE